MSEKKKDLSVKNEVTGFYIYIFVQFNYEVKPIRAITTSTFNSLAEFRDSLSKESQIEKKMLKTIKKFKENVNFSEYDCDEEIVICEGVETILLRQEFVRSDVQRTIV